MPGWSTSCPVVKERLLAPKAKMMPKKYMAILMKSLKENLSFHWPVNVILAGALLFKPWLLWTSHCKYTVDFKSKLKLMSALTTNF